MLVVGGFSFLLLILASNIDLINEVLWFETVSDTRGADKSYVCIITCHIITAIID
jgi:hypothetical protein